MGWTTAPKNWGFGSCRLWKLQGNVSLPVGLRWGSQWRGCSGLSRGSKPNHRKQGCDACRSGDAALREKPCAQEAEPGATHQGGHMPRMLELLGAQRGRKDSPLEPLRGPGPAIPSFWAFRTGREWATLVFSPWSGCYNMPGDFSPNIPGDVDSRHDQVLRPPWSPPSPPPVAAPSTLHPHPLPSLTHLSMLVLSPNETP